MTLLVVGTICNVALNFSPLLCHNDLHLSTTTSVGINSPQKKRNKKHSMLNFFHISSTQCCQLGMVSSPLCSIWFLKTVATCMHMFLDSPEVKSFWLQVANILEVFIPCLPHTLLLNYDSTLTKPFYQKKVFLAVTAAKNAGFRVETSSYILY